MLLPKIARLFELNHLPGGAKGTRTPGLLHAMQALYQLSYSPSAVASAADSATPVYKI